MRKVPISLVNFHHKGDKSECYVGMKMLHVAQQLGAAAMILRMAHPFQACFNN